MDIRCKHCREPWELDSLHDCAPLTFDEARDAFYRYGCGLFDAVGIGIDEVGGLELRKCTRGGGQPASLAIDALQELMGDDVDGLAAMLDDATYLYGEEIL